MQVSLRKYTEAQSTAFYQDVIRRVDALPAVVTSAISTALPPTATHMTAILFEGQPNVPFGKRPIINLQQTSPDYAKALGVPLLAGRSFSGHDDAQSPKVAMINQAAVKRFFGEQNPVGKRVWIGNLPAPAEIVGVLSDTRNSSLALPATPEVFYGTRRRESGYSTPGDPERIAADRDRDRDRVCGIGGGDAAARIVAVSNQRDRSAHLHRERDSVHPSSRGRELHPGAARHAHRPDRRLASGVAPPHGFAKRRLTRLRCGRWTARGRLPVTNTGAVAQETEAERLSPAIGPKPTTARRCLTLSEWQHRINAWSLAAELQKIYDSEINVRISWFLMAESICCSAIS
jgi:hypothetical protein